MNILVLNPSSQVAKNVVRDVIYGCWCKGKRIGGGSVPPFALLSLASLLERHHRVILCDAQAEQLGWDEIAARAAGFDLAVLSTSVMTFREDVSLLGRLRQAHPRLRSVTFGSHPTFMPHYCLASPEVDIIVRHEPEYAVRDLAEALDRADGSWRAVPGIGFRDGEGDHLNPLYPFIGNLDELPWPDVDLLPEGIHYFNPLVRRMPYVTAVTSRGCPGQCIFCTAPAFDGPRLRFQTAEYVVREMEYFQSKGYKEVFFRDETFFVHKKRDAEICRRLIDQRLDMTWLANARVSHMDAQTMELARRAGCHTMKFGIESGTQEILDRMRKGYRLERALEVFASARSIGMNTHAHVMLGNPGETRETLKRTVDFVHRLRPTTATFGLCTPYPGTPLFDEVAKVHPEIADGSVSDLSMLHEEGLFNEHYTDLTRRDLQGVVKRAYRAFYLHPIHCLDLVRGHIRGVSDVKRVSLAAAKVLDFAFRGDS